MMPWNRKSLVEKIEFTNSDGKHPTSVALRGQKLTENAGIDPKTFEPKPKPPTLRVYNLINKT